MCVHGYDVIAFCFGRSGTTQWRGGDSLFRSGCDLLCILIVYLVVIRVGLLLYISLLTERTINASNTNIPKRARQLDLNCTLPSRRSFSFIEEFYLRMNKVLKTLVLVLVVLNVVGAERLGKVVFSFLS